jgi:hypothetical protein
MRQFRLKEAILSGAQHAPRVRSPLVIMSGCERSDMLVICVIVVRRWLGRRWIACRTALRRRRRDLMQPHSYTELFFLDEATAFAAGHRPYAECRYDDHHHFKEGWMRTHGEAAGVEQIDATLHYAPC